MLQTIYLGTYTRRESKGIYSIALDTEKGTLTDLTLCAEEKVRLILPAVKRSSLQRHRSRW